MSNFVDHVKITVKSGNGGNGSMSFHREKFVMNGGPDGGDGGRGGDVMFLADLNMHTLLDFRFKSKYTAENGGDGSAGNCSGKRGENLIIKVPVGTVVKDAETGKVLLDLHEAGQCKCLMKGGKGGWGNTHFSTPTRQAPHFAKPGVKTEPRALLLELKTIADVGLVGFPNVGKSTILSVVTSARPKIANYHFTTLTPNLGMVRHHGEDFIMADIPGLVEGAADGTGLGHAFLRHVERTRLLLHVVDASGSEGRDPVVDFDTINLELSRYGNLAELPQILVCNKADLPGFDENLERLKAHVADRNIPVFSVSAATRKGFDPLMNQVIQLLKTLPPIQSFPETLEEEEAMERPDGFQIEMEGKIYHVLGPSMERLLNSINFDDEESLNYFHRTLRRMGVIDALREKGAKEGDTVQIEDMAFDFVD